MTENPPAKTAETAPPLSIVMPTANRSAVLAETLRRFAEQAPAGTEMVISIEGDDPDSIAVAEATGARVVEVESGAGPGAARNAAISAARSAICLLCDDDVRPAPGMVSAHIDFHAAESDPMAALMGRVVPEPPLDRSEFQRWLHEDGIQFGFGMLEEGEVEGRFLWVANASFKKRGLDAVGGFDGAIGFGSEDADLGMRFVAGGGRIVYRPQVLGLHHRPTDLARTLERMRRIGRDSRNHPGRLRESTEPRRTGAAHRVLLAALAAAERAGLARGPVRRAAWRALCKQAYREAYWEEPERRGEALARRLGDRMSRDDPASD